MIQLGTRVLVVAGLLLAACGSSTTPPSGPGPTATPKPAASDTAAASALPTEPSPLATPVARPGEGASDPAGRIAFGRVARMDSFYGQVISIWAIDPDGSDLTQLNRGDSGFPAWSPDGSRLAFTQLQADGTWQVATMAPDGSDVRVLTSGHGADVASWSPDGTWLAYSRFMTGTDDPAFSTTIWRVNADGSDARLLGDQKAFDVEPRISPDGTAVLFERLAFDGGVQRQALVVRDIETGRERVITAVGTAVEHANWSPDGAWIVYDVSPNLGGVAPSDQIERIAADGTGDISVLFEGTGTRGGFKPWYSPDGTRILFGCFLVTGGSDGACLANADGSNVNVLIDDPAQDENHFSWGPAR